MFQPRGIFQTLNLSNVAQAVFTGGRRVAGFFIVGGAAAEIVIFRKIDDTEYFRIPVAIGALVDLSKSEFYANGGLELITASAAGDVQVVVFYDNASF